MARFKRRLKTQPEPPRPVVTDDFIYDNPDDVSPKDPVGSDTPEEAIRKLRGASRSGDAPKEPGSEKPVSNKTSSEDFSGVEEDHLSTGTENTGDEGDSSKKGRVYSSGIMLDDNLQPIHTSKRRKAHPVLRGIALGLVTFVLLAIVAAYIFHRISPDTPYLDKPENAISSIMTPVQSFFSGITETVAGYFRTLKLRANIEAEYEALRAENEQLVYKAMLAEELQNTLSRYEDLSDEIAANRSMRPIICTVIGKSDSNYFSTLTINKGTADGVEDYMAVTISGALVGYTESTKAHQSVVRTVIDSDASIAALIQSSRDQGTVRGTLGIDGTPMCRMYYLPDDNLPRPGDQVVTSGVGMSFPKGIPIGIIRESTRGMEANKQYIVLEPLVDFKHLEYVIVLRYKPEPIAVEGRENGRTSMELVPLESARPSPIVPEIADSLFDDVTATPTPGGQTTPAPGEIPSAAPEEIPSAAPEETATLTPAPSAAPAATPDYTPLEYQIINLSGEPTPSPTPTTAPTPTPYVTPDPDAMTYEED